MKEIKMSKVIFIFALIILLLSPSLFFSEDVKERENELTRQHVNVLKKQLKIIKAIREQKREDIMNNNKKTATIEYLNDKGEWVKQ